MTIIVPTPRCRHREWNLWCCGIHNIRGFIPQCGSLLFFLKSLVKEMKEKFLYQGQLIKQLMKALIQRESISPVKPLTMDHPGIVPDYNMTERMGELQPLHPLSHAGFEYAYSKVLLLNNRSISPAAGGETQWKLPYIQETRMFQKLDEPHVLAVGRCQSINTRIPFGNRWETTYASRNILQM